jgi:hypothetical protein
LREIAAAMATIATMASRMMMSSVETMPAIKRSPPS